MLPLNQPSSPVLVSPTTPKQNPHFSIISATNGTAEVNTVQPVSLRQSRGARLSFLGGRKKEHPPSAHMNLNGGQNTIPEVADIEVPAMQEPPRKNIFRSHSHEIQQSMPRLGHGVSISASNGTHSNGSLTRSATDTSDWVTDSGRGSRGSHDTHVLSGTLVSSIDKERDSSGGAGMPKMSGMKKRLSMLKLGGRKGKTNTMMGALSEE